MKPGTNVYQMSRRCLKGYQGQRSKVKVMTRSNAIMAEACISTVRCGVEADLFTDDSITCRCTLRSDKKWTSRILSLTALN